jgi:hypothetical protein
MKPWAIVVLVLLLAATAFGVSKKKPVDSAAPTASQASVDSVWVQKPDGGQQCAPDSAKPLDAHAEELQRAGVQILQSKKGSDGKMRIQLCGSPSGSQNAYEIRRSDLSKAKALGFEEAVVTQ